MNVFLRYRKVVFRPGAGLVVNRIHGYVLGQIDNDDTCTHFYFNRHEPGDVDGGIMFFFHFYNIVTQ